MAGFNERDVSGSIKEIVEKNEVSNGRCRVTFFDESSSKIWQTEGKDQTSLLIQTAGLRKSKQLVSLTLSPFVINSNSPLIGVKSCNYLENIIALENAREVGFDESIRINERNEVVSACMANIFWFESNKKELFTPSLKTGCLAGTIRDFLIERYEVQEVEKEINTLFRDAETLFLTSSGIGIVQVLDFNREIRFESNLHELTEAINRELGNGSAAA